ncbi:Na+/H+ antiporter [Dactylosporangium vinaceum]|uniref:Na+/H+ antiporter n=1 Tax=Dactylosporangium vinaceum TaxID=53362 RepID=A0ABV5MR03_9ACTN|nr:Na+/H+ antiporter [Dactylosporangium vinaceum]UAC00667.1 Na+/H+ antiporter [Dactylosporangium vinaceum]
MSPETLLLLGLSALAVVAAVRWVGEKTGLPGAALLPVIGILYALLPGPNVELDPHIVLTFILPPLLYSAALDSSLLAIRNNLRIVIGLSVLLVLATALLVGAGFALFVTGATLAAGVAVGAAVAPPDPVAALAVGRKVGLPPRLITIIQGEGLLNDATALTILNVAVAAAVGGEFSFPAAAGRFLLVAIGGTAVGVIVAFAVRLLRPIAKDALLANAVSLATPFVAYLAAEKVHVSGVLAVVVAGLIVGHHTPRSGTGAGRLQTSAVWHLIDFLLEGLVFLLIGQQLPEVLRGLRQYSGPTIAIALAVSVGVALLLRPVWLMLTQAMHLLLRRDDEGLGGREIAALSWAGTRGVISLAAVFTIPLTTDAGLPFPDRDLLLFCTFVVVLVTLVGQGLTFAPLVRLLKLRVNAVDEARMRNEARAAAVHAALDRLDDLDRDEPAERSEIDALRRRLQERLRRYHHRLDVLQNADSDELPVSERYEAGLRIRRLAIEAQREELLRRRDAGTLPDEALRRLERELDHEERVLPDRPA